MEEQKPIYHEKQRLQFCLLHALNNLMQEKDSFRRAELDAIAEKLLVEDPFKGQWTPLSLIFKPHHNVFTGNYDINVLIAALESRRKTVVWHDRRNEANSINLAEESLMGLMLNVPVRRYAGLWNSRHWVSLRSINHVWYNLDSDLSEPMPFENEEEMIQFLNNVIYQGGEILIILHEKLSVCSVHR
ncbi:josephin-like protein [Curcuma longa]|uniref:josephin-like protein n=1 Tax=Curcuma longa TaxID=136217 RepID=UPI003D9F2B9D